MLSLVSWYSVLLVYYFFSYLYISRITATFFNLEGDRWQDKPSILFRAGTHILNLSPNAWKGRQRARTLTPRQKLAYRPETNITQHHSLVYPRRIIVDDHRPRSSSVLSYNGQRSFFYVLLMQQINPKAGPSLLL